MIKAPAVAGAFSLSVQSGTPLFYRLHIIRIYVIREYLFGKVIGRKSTDPYRKNSTQLFGIKLQAGI